MAFKMKKSVMKLVVEAGDNRKVENKESKSRSGLVPGKGEYEGKMVDPRTGMPPGVSSRAKS